MIPVGMYDVKCIGAVVVVQTTAPALQLLPADLVIVP